MTVSCQMGRQTQFNLGPDAGRGGANVAGRGGASVGGAKVAGKGGAGASYSRACTRRRMCLKCLFRNRRAYCSIVRHKNT